MAIRFLGLAMMQQRQRSRSRSPQQRVARPDELTQVRGGRKQPRARTPSPPRVQKVVKEVGIGRRKTAGEFAMANTSATPSGLQKSSQAKPKPKMRACVALAGSDQEDDSG